jgi:predicted negative regulator of RcsB-dependent stress response
LTIVLIGGWYVYKLNYETNASKLYARVFESAMKADGPTGDAGTIKGYKDLVAQYPRSRAAVTAYLRLGNIYFNGHEVDTAISYYQDFLRKSAGDSDLMSLAYNSLGCCYEAKKDYTKAVEFFQMALKADTASSFAAINYSGIARIYEAMNDRIKAAESYRTALEKTTDSLMMVYLKKKIANLV